MMMRLPTPVIDDDEDELSSVGEELFSFLEEVLFPLSESSSLELFFVPVLHLLAGVWEGDGLLDR